MAKMLSSFEGRCISEDEIIQINILRCLWTAVEHFLEYFTVVVSFVWTVFHRFAKHTV